MKPSHGCSNAMEQTTSPCWCHFVEALIDCRLLDVAEEAKNHLQKSTSNVTMGSPNTSKDLHMKDKLCVDDHGRASVVRIISRTTNEVT